MVPYRLLDGSEWWGCPRRPIKDAPEAWGALIGHLKRYRAGVLPDDGAWAQQAVKLARQIELLDGYLADAEAKKMEQIRTKG